MPIHYKGRLVGWTSMFGHQNDTGGPVPSSLPTDATTIFGEALRIPPFKLYEGGILNDVALNIILANVRQPEMNRADLMALVAACRTGAQRIRDLCERFGTDTYLAMKSLISQVMPQGQAARSPKSRRTSRITWTTTAAASAPTRSR